MSILTVENFALLITAFLLGGIVKGIIGTGLPTVALGIITATIGLKEAMAIILLPSLITNIGQGLLGGHLAVVFKRSWSFLLMTFFTVWVGASLIPLVNIGLLSALLGTILLVYSAVGLSSPHLPNPGRAEAWLSPLFGSVNGLLTGLTGSSIVPGVLYLQSLGMSRDLLIQTMGLLFLVSTATLGLALNKNELLTGELLLLSAIAFVPAFIGMQVGIRIRYRISEALFRKLFFFFMLALGCYIIGRALYQGVY